MAAKALTVFIIGPVIKNHDARSQFSFVDAESFPIPHDVSFWE
jgi:hypothetical protein